MVAPGYDCYGTVSNTQMGEGSLHPSLPPSHQMGSEHWSVAVGVVPRHKGKYPPFVLDVHDVGDYR